MVRKLISRARGALDKNNVGIESNISLEANQGTPPGRYPIGDGFYRTPEVIDPRDPINYPDSPWNGGNPIDSVPFALDIGLSIHRCGFDIDVGGTFGFVRTPVGGISYRYPGECRNEPPTPTPGAINEMEDKAMNWDDYVANDSDIVICAVGLDTYTFGHEERYKGGQIITGFGGTNGSWNYSGLVANYTRLFANGVNSYSSSFDTGEAIISARLKSDEFFTMDEIWRSFYWYSHTPLVSTKRFDGTVSITKYSADNDTLRVNAVTTGPIGAYPIFFIGTFRNLKNEVPLMSKKTIRNYTGPAPYYLTESDTSIYYRHVDIFVNLSTPPYSKNPPPPELDEKECCMECCQQTNQQQEDYSDLLKQILKIVTNIEKRVGANDYPFTVPSSLIKQSDSWISSLVPTPPKTINNAQEWLRHLYLTIDELLGEFEIPIEIKDADPTTPGEQPQGMKILNVAEGLGEMIGIQTVSAVNSEVTVQMLTKILYELGALRQTGADSNSKTKTLIEFFGYKTTEKEEKIKLSFTAGKDKLDETLKESEHPITITLFDDGKQTYKHDAAKLLEAAAIIKAVNRKKVNLGDSAAAALDIAKNVRELAKNKADQDKILGKKQDDDFNKVIDDFESGFIATPGIDNASNPFGEPYETRPKVIRLNTEPSTTPGT